MSQECPSGTSCDSRENSSGVSHEEAGKENSETPPQGVNPENVPASSLPVTEEVSPRVETGSDSGDEIVCVGKPASPAPYSQREVTISEYGHYREKAEKVLGYEIGVCLPVDGSQWSDPVSYRQTTGLVAPEDEYESLKHRS